MMNEDEILTKLKNKSTRHQAFEMIVHTYQQSLYWYIRRMVTNHEDADDILQNTFLKAWTHLDSFQEKSKLSTWLFRIAINETLTHIQSEKKNLMRETINESHLSSIESDAYFDGDEIQKQLQIAINTLPPKQRAVFNLKYFQEMKYEEMSQAMNTSIGALKASYHHAIKKLLLLLTIN